MRKYDDFSLYFLANLPEGVEIPLDIYSQEASTLRGSLFYPVLELTHNHGTEHNSEFVYENGNNEPYRGFGHIGFLVDDVTLFHNIYRFMKLVSSFQNQISKLKKIPMMEI